MKLYSLIKNINCRVRGRLDLDIFGLYHSDKLVKENGMYFCLNGANFNGKDFANSAISAGAVAVVTDEEISGINGVTQIIVKNVRKTMSLIACNFYNEPAKKLKFIGITGTNGKTTTVHIIADLLNKSNKQVAIIGTNGIEYKNKVIQTNMTTPDPIELQKNLAKLVKGGVEYICIEVSAHSIYYDKLEGIIFEIMIFSNLTEDHLDFFKTMGNYFYTKGKIFNLRHTKCALINIDDKYGKILYNGINLPKYTYSIDNKSDYKSEDLGIENHKQKFCFNNLKLKSCLLGKFNIYNLTASIACLDILNIKLKNIENAVCEIKEVAGRFNCIVINKKLFIIDYAHTPDGLENVLRLCKNIANDKKVICIFGCGGNRETQKRSKMGEISSKYADLTIISTDNPRFEEKEKIARDIEKGIKNDKYKIILDRKEAIKFAYDFANDGDIILIAGKGAENYIEEKGVKLKYNDYDEIKKLENVK